MMLMLLFVKAHRPAFNLLIDYLNSGLFLRFWVAVGGLS